MRILTNLDLDTVRTLARYVGSSLLMYMAVGIAFSSLSLRSASIFALFAFYVVVYAVDFLVNQRIVFQTEHGAVVRYIATTICSIVLVAAITSVVANVGVPNIVVPAVASVIVFPVRFLIYRYWVYAPSARSEKRSQVAK